ncbi:hypothetical protein MVEN_01161200 [Mycena venus]|uniref:Uncharacterized protein n=1 Tax=Mycena venus TaxID=2733690 RepID=A0A8H6Y0W0_9AGAR|nr:hypothetical protein MVEN_01161200 [Mycena venus]
MDNVSIPPPSCFPIGYSFITVVAPIPTTIPRPIYGVPQYDYHGLPFGLLPPKIQSFLTSHGLEDRAHYDPAAVASVRLWLSDKLLDTVSRICEAIVLVNIRYNLFRTMYPPEHAFLTALTRLLHRELLPELERHMGEHVAYADALVWADVSAREGSPEALSVEEALQYRWLQTQPTVDLVATRIVELYEWAAAMWMMGWRSDGYTTYLQLLPPPSSSPPVSGEQTHEPSEPPLVPPPADTPSPSLSSSSTFTPLSESSPPMRPSTPPRQSSTPSSSSTPSPKTPPQRAPPRNRLAAESRSKCTSLGLAGRRAIRVRALYPTAQCSFACHAANSAHAR